MLSQVRLGLYIVKTINTLNNDTQRGVTVEVRPAPPLLDNHATSLFVLSDLP